jgi:ESS family glutamate:Na+ symporter
MEFWTPGAVTTLLALAAVMAVTASLTRAIPGATRLGLPPSILAGTAAFLLGPGALGWLALDLDVLKVLVYHALAIVFIAVSLETPRVTPAGRGRGARSMAFAITAMVAMQTAVGLLVVLGLDLFGEAVHPGFGLLLPLGFEQGPGQALSMGAAWERSGLPSGADVGLIVAAIGFVWSIAVGVPLVAIGRWRGWTTPSDGAAHADGPVAPLEATAGYDPLTRQLLIVGALYALTGAACWGLDRALTAAGLLDIAAMVWGFHYMIGALIALGARPILARTPGGSPIDDALLARVAAVTVDVATVAALAAVQIAVLTAYWWPVLAVTTVGGLATLALSLAVARRAFPDAPFEHAVMWFGMSTGTAPVGLALLRVLDPELRSPVPVNVVLGSALAILGVAPIVLVLHPLAITAWGETWPGGGWLALGAVCAYGAVVGGGWWLIGGLRRASA